jgi:hypothetical protein
MRRFVSLGIFLLHEAFLVDFFLGRPYPSFGVSPDCRGLLSSLKSPRTEANEIAAGQGDHVLDKLIERARHGDSKSVFGCYIE